MIILTGAESAPSTLDDGEFALPIPVRASVLFLFQL